MTNEKPKPWERELADKVDYDRFMEGELERANAKINLLERKLRLAMEALNRIANMVAYAGVPSGQTKEEFEAKLSRIVGNQAPQKAYDAIKEIEEMK